jgi:hypothetical protein
LDKNQNRGTVGPRAGQISEKLSGYEVSHIGLFAVFRCCRRVTGPGQNPGNWAFTCRKAAFAMETFSGTVVISSVVVLTGLAGASAQSVFSARVET